MRSGLFKSGILWITCTLLLLAACQSCTPYLGLTTALTQWLLTDLRTLDPADAVQAEQDILAIYVRSSPIPSEKRLEIRLDFLSLSMRSQLDLYVIIDHKPGGTLDLPLSELDRPATADIEWDTLLVFPANAPLQGFDFQGKSRPDLALRLWQDSVQDTFILSLNPKALPSGFINWQFQTFTTSPDSQQIEDRVNPVFLDAQPPSQAAVLLAFWNTFPAYTPAQAVRRWSGAHTGPLGGSHGLAFLLRASQRYHIPLTLLDLNTPVSLSALEYAGGMDLVQELATKELLILPDDVPIGFGNLVSAPYPTPAWLLARVSKNNIQSALKFRLPVSQFLYGYPQAEVPDRYLGIFTPEYHQQEILEPVFAQRAGHLRVIPIPSQITKDQATLDGPSVPVRKALIDTALAAESSNSSENLIFLVLGGDLTESTWGEPRRTRATFEYINSHPWIKPLDAYSLLTINPTSSWHNEFPEARYTLPVALLNHLKEPEQGRLAQATWQTYLALNTPVSSNTDQLTSLRLNYIGQVNSLLTASDWELNPRSISTCQEDPDLDGETECVLASESIFTIFEVEEGSLSYAFVRTLSGVHQMIGPTSQLVVGLSEPETWDLNLGERADPSIFMGAFTDSEGPYRVTILGNRLRFRSETTEKIFMLTPAGFTFTYHSQAPQSLQIPIILDPWERFQPGWGERYTLELIRNGAIWSLTGGAIVHITADTPIGANVFTDTRSRMGFPENPNFDYPPGHYLPYPLILLTLETKTDIHLTVTIKD